MTTIEGQFSTSVDTLRSLHGPSSLLPDETSTSTTQLAQAQATIPSASITSSTTTMTSTTQLPPKAPLSILPTHQGPSPALSSRPTSPTPSSHSLSDNDSESSFPSVSSSFFFSSAAHSPYSNPYSQPHSNDSGGEYEDQGEGLHMIIPSLTLPGPVHPASKVDEVGGGRKEEVRLIVVVGPDMLKEIEQSLVGAYWEEREEKEGLKVLRGLLNRRESDPESDTGKRNLRVALWVVEHSEAQNAREITRIIRRLVISSFSLLDSRMHLEHEADSLASSTFFSDIYTAVLICPTASLTDHVGEIGDLIPSILLDLPISQQTLQDLVLPTGLSRQKKEVADNFLRWRASGHDRDATHVQGEVQRIKRWSKADWEREIEEELGVSLYSLSSPLSSPSPPAPITAHVPPHTVHRFATARAARRRLSRGMLALSRNSPSPEATIISPRPRSPKSAGNGNGGVRPRKRPLSPPPPPPLLSSPSPTPSQTVPPHHSVIVDPLHLPSLVMLGVELVGAIRARVFGNSRRVQKELEMKRVTGRSSGGSRPVKFLMLGFCVGVGVGVWLGRVVWGTI
ncbi:hypothetical protein L218DRAFT_1078009 [Marasmius fiardii PR-910]|nr:hypothetical protein L218DRAFT_1078009 [Marasmius fiardii PR-910]